MDLTVSKAKLIVIIVVFVAIFVSGIGLYAHFHASSGNTEIDKACQRAADYHKLHNGPLDELTADDAVCQSRIVRSAT